MFKNKMLYKRPLSVNRLGKSTFLKLPLYPTKTLFEPIYINSSLFQTLFKKKNYSWEQQSEWIRNLFSITLEPDRSLGEPCGWAYVDKQGEDPYGISLVGNLGSGRAFYTGKYFNIKGEKTPLATSLSATHSNGILKTVDGIWSALVGNSLYEEFSVKPSPVLAILKQDESRCLIIRIDEEGALDRITHLFYNPRPISFKQLKITASHLGRFEAEKWIHRILHGAWSAGNTSLSGHLIDYDSVCAVKGRQPQYSFSEGYPDNYFGFEELGQIKILKIICDDPLLNHQNIALEQLTPIFHSNFKKRLLEGLIELMGFENSQSLASANKDAIEKLAETFFELSHYTYCLSQESLYANFPDALFFHLFDFSTLFRFYPLLKRYHPEKDLSSFAWSLLTESPGQTHYLEQPSPPLILTPQVKDELDNYLLTSSSTDSTEPKKKAKAWIQNFIYTFDSLLQTSKQSLDAIVARAYTVNEDRLYLFPVFSLEGFLIQLQNKESPYVIHRFIEHLIRANQRFLKINSEDQYSVNFRLIQEGFVHSLINIHGEYQVVVTLYKDKLQEDLDEKDSWQLQAQDDFVSCIAYFFPDKIEIRSLYLPNSQLINIFARDDVFLINSYIMYRNGTPFKLTDLFYPDKSVGYYL